MKLNVRPYPVKGESLDSFLFRLARENGLKFSLLSLVFSNVARTLKTRDESKREIILKKTEELCGYNLSDFIVDIRQANRSYNSVIEFKKIRLCPLCFKESNGVINSTFVLKRVLVCKKHSVFIKDNCTSCGAPFNSETIVSGRCLDCKESITEDPWSISCDSFSTEQNDEFEQVRTAPVSCDKTRSQHFNELIDTVALPIFRKWELATEIIKLHEEWSQKKATIHGNKYEQQYFQQVNAYSLYHDKSLIEKKLHSVLTKAYKVKQFNLQILFVTLIKFSKIEETMFVFEILKDLLITHRQTFPNFEVNLTWLVSTGMSNNLNLKSLKTLYRPNLLKSKKSIYLKDFR